jgi:antitoxin component of MazEF toxin-antitoxin module
MRVKAINIGDSVGIIFPDSILKQLGDNTEFDLVVYNEKLVLSPVVKSARAGWREHFEKIKIEPLTQEDKDFINFGNKFDDKDWTW